MKLQTRARLAVGNGGPLSRQVSEDLMSRIGGGEFPPGSRLPGETALMAEYGVGRNTVREAMQGLVALGLLDIRPRRGAIVLTANPQQILPRDTLSAVLDTKSVKDLYEVRLVLEAYSARLAAQRHTAEDFDRIRKALIHFRLAKESGAPVWEADLEFHHAIALASENTVLPRLLEATADLLADARRATERIPEAVERAADEHVAIAQAIEERDANRAHAEMTRHIRSAIWAITQIPEVTSSPSSASGVH